MIGYVRSRCVLRSLIGAWLSLAIVGIAFSSEVPLYFDPDKSTIRLGMIAPVVAAVILNMSLGDPIGEAEVDGKQRLRHLRMFHGISVVLVVMLSSSALVAIEGWSDRPVVLARNSAILIGTTLICASLVTSRQAWVAPVAIGVGTYGFGMDYVEAAPRWWAVLLHASTGTTLIAGAFVFFVGLVVFVVFGPRDSGEME